MPVHSPYSQHHWTTGQGGIEGPSHCQGLKPPKMPAPFPPPSLSLPGFCHPLSLVLPHPTSSLPPPRISHGASRKSSLLVRGACFRRSGSGMDLCCCQASLPAPGPGAICWQATQPLPCRGTQVFPLRQQHHHWGHP